MNKDRLIKVIKKAVLDDEEILSLQCFDNRRVVFQLKSNQGIRLLTDSIE